MFRVELMNYKCRWDLAEFVSIEQEGLNLIENKYDNYFARLVKCGRRRETVFRNFGAVHFPA